MTIARMISGPPWAATECAGVTLAWLLLAVGDVSGATAAVDPYLPAPSSPTSLAGQVNALVIAAIAHRRNKDTEQAMELLERGLLLAEPEGLLQPFVNGGSAIRIALTTLVQTTGPHSSFARKIAWHIDSRPRVGASQTADSSLPLSDKELAVLRFLPSQLTNEEIGQALYMSVNTVKTHLRSAYRKLGARSRRDAIALARQRGVVAS